MSQVVRVDCGLLRGGSSHGIAAYKSIPYAKPPIASLRWQPPVQLLPGDGCWNGTLDATSFSPACLQVAHYGNGSSSSEDCLRLHVWAPSGLSNLSLSPVFVWLHGGGLLEGSAFSIQSGYEAIGRLPATLGAVVVRRPLRRSPPLSPTSPLTPPPLLPPPPATL